MTDDEYRDTIDAEQVAQARGKPWPDRSRVRRVRIDDTPHRMAQAVRADHEREREREGADDAAE